LWGKKKESGRQGEARHTFSENAVVKKRAGVASPPGEERTNAYFGRKIPGT